MTDCPGSSFTFFPSSSHAQKCVFSAPATSPDTPEAISAQIADLSVLISKADMRKGWLQHEAEKQKAEAKIAKLTTLRADLYLRFIQAEKKAGMPP
jgi:hypothetical protein